VTQPRTKEPVPDRRGLFALAGVGIAILLLVLWSRGGTGGGPRGDGSDRDATDGELDSHGRRAYGHRDGAGDGGVLDPDAGGRPLQPPHPLERPAEIVDPQLPGPEADPESYDPGPGTEYIERYHGRSGRLSPHASTSGSQTSVPQRSHMAPPNIAAWIESHVAVPGQPVIIHAMVVGRQGEVVTPSAMSLIVFRAEPEDGVEVPIQSTQTDYQGEYTPTLEAHPMTEDGRPAQVQFLVRATGTYEGTEYSRSVTSWFLVSSPGARADFDHPNIAQEGGDLVMRVPVQVSAPGTYYGSAELWGGREGGTPIAFARTREYLDMTATSFSFLFGGAVIGDSHVDGPYMIRNARFMSVDTHPPHEQPPVDVVAATPPWPASSFH
jgi:hypothetical protein